MTKQMMVFLVIIVYVLVQSYFVEPNMLEVTHYSIENSQLGGVRVAFLTDFHLKKHDFKRLDKIVRLTNEQNPDIVLLGGDYATGHDYDKMMNMDIAAQKLSLLNAPTYSVLGEHDWWSNGVGIADALRKNRIKVLENSAARLYVRNQILDIVGLADLSTRKVEINTALYRTKLPRIIVMHNPDSYYDILDDATLILSGHTHGGQFILPFSPPLFVPSKYGSKFAGGLITATRNKMIISKGLGTSVVPLRFNCKPEIVVVDFARQ